MSDELSKEAADRMNEIVEMGDYRARVASFEEELNDVAETLGISQEEKNALILKHNEPDQDDPEWLAWALTYLDAKERAKFGITDDQ